MGACTRNSSKTYYVLAEKLFDEKKYDAAVKEFNKVVNDNPNTKLGEQALYRIAVIQYLYTNEYDKAIYSFETYRKISTDKDLEFSAAKSVADIYFSKLETYARSAEVYKELIKKYPKKESDIFLFKLAKSKFYTLKFDEAISSFEELIKSYPQSNLVKESELQIANIYFTKGFYEDAIENYLKVINKNKNTNYEVLAKFGLANSLAEMDDIDGAFKIYKQIVNTYPSKNVIELKMKKIRERKILKGM